VYNYSNISLEKLEEDLKNTIEECKDLVSNIKSSEISIYQILMSWRVQFMMFLDALRLWEMYIQMKK